MLLGCIADDFTGATDLANTLTREGLACIQFNGLPGAQAQIPAFAQAAVIALKSRSAPAEQAVEQSLGALAFLRSAGCRRFFFKYCSTFDSTDDGNIGPVTEALLDALGSDFTIACPAVPENGRTVYQGHLFVGATPLAETGMRHHPLTPMTDSNLVRVLGRQMTSKVGLVPAAAVAAGPAAIAEQIAALRESGHRCAIVDALSEPHLRNIAAATAGLSLLTGGSGLALGLPTLLGAYKGERPDLATAFAGLEEGPAAVLAGSCSEATNCQVAHLRAEVPALRLDPLALARDPTALAQARSWAEAQLGACPILIYATTTPDELAKVQADLGRERAGQVVEQALAAIAQDLVAQGVTRLVVAGGESSGAVVSALGVKALAIGAEIDPGVPWTVSLQGPRVALALKSGNFGGPDFFSRAFETQP